MASSVERYLRRGKFHVDGWLRNEAARTVVTLIERQHATGIRGGIAEIGVHHRKLFILPYLLGREREKAVAVDLFEDQHLNVDHSGSGDLAKFRHNLERHADSRLLVLHEGKSMELTGADLTRLAGGPLAFVSVDGGHTRELTEHDLETAEASIAEGGITVVDDVLPRHRPSSPRSSSACRCAGPGTPAAHCAAA